MAKELNKIPEKCSACEGFGRVGDFVCFHCGGDGKFHKEKYTCNECVNKETCMFAWDEYNTDGDCLDLK